MKLGNSLLLVGFIGGCLSFGGMALAESGDLERGESLAASCVACHGAGGISTVPSMFPHLAGRDAEELAGLLRAYRSGELQNSMMSPHAQRLSDQDIADLSAYYASQQAAD